MSLSHLLLTVLMVGLAVLPLVAIARVMAPEDSVPEGVRLPLNCTTQHKRKIDMNLIGIASIALAFGLIALPQLVIYFVSRESDKYQEPECDYDYR